MNTRCHALILLFASGCFLAAQEPAAEPAVAAAPRDYAPRTAAELDQLLGPIALYPDALIALILPAATTPADIVLAARQLKDSHDDLSQVESRAWDESVKSLTHYPDVLRWMDENLSWTKQVGEAFAEEPAAVMESIQRLRAQARDAGTLFSTPQQQILAEPGVIRIIPAQPDLIYVPRYEPDLVYLAQPAYYPYWNSYPYSNSFLTFGAGFPVGSWLAYDFDWRQRTIWVGDRHRRWRGHDWHRPLVPVPPGFAGTPAAHQWRPPPRPPRPPLAATPRYVPEAGRPPGVITGPTRPYSTRGSIASGRPEVISAPRAADLNSRIRGTAVPRNYASPRVTPVAGNEPPASPPAQSIATPAPVSAPPPIRRGNSESQRDRSAVPRNHSNPTVNPIPRPGPAPLTMAGQAPSPQPGTGHRGTWQPPASVPTVARPVPTQNQPPPPIQAAPPAPARQPPPAQVDDRRPRREN